MIRYTAKRPIGIAFGDSITEQGFDGWVAGLAYFFSRKVDIINRGFSGYNTEYALSISKDVFSQYINDDVLFVTICFGANDSAIPNGLPSCQYIPPEQYKSNLSTIIDIIKEILPKTYILLISPPPIEEKKLFQYVMDIEDDNCTVDPNYLPRTNKRAKEYSIYASEVATKKNVSFLDMHKKITDYAQENKEPLSEFFSDGIHLNNNGNNIFLNEIINDFKKNAKVDGQNFLRTLKFDYPLWENFRQQMKK